jgi:hypothetical protein
MAAAAGAPGLTSIKTIATMITPIRNCQISSLFIGQLHPLGLRGWVNATVLGTP